MNTVLTPFSPVRFEDGEPAAAEATMCKLFGLEAVGRVTDRALLVGYTRASLWGA